MQLDKVGLGNFLHLSDMSQRSLNAMVMARQNLGSYG